MSALEPGPYEVTTEPFVLEGMDGALVPAFHARPVGSPRAGLVVHPDISGLRPLFEDLARSLATHGYAVAAFEPFGRRDEEERAAMGLAERFAAIPGLVDDQQLGDMTRAADELTRRDGVETTAVAGFCMGGMYALKVAATGRFDRAVSFYGMITVPEDWRSPRAAEPLTTAAEVCPTLAILGGADPWTPEPDVAALRAAWSNRPDCEIVVYPEADHGFVHDPGRPAHRPDDAADVWRRVLAFLEPGE